MHQQIRSTPALSPADLEAFLKVLAAKGINIEAAGGSDIELGGEFAFSVADGGEKDALWELASMGYKVRLVSVHAYPVDPTREGELLRCVQDAKAQPDNEGKSIRDIAIGVEKATGQAFVQIYFE